MKIAYQDLTVDFDEKRLQYLISAGKTTWQSKDSFSPYFTVKKEAEKGREESLSAKENGIEYAFTSAGKMQHRIVKTGVGIGIRSSYEDFPVPLRFETYVWIEYSTRQLYFEWIPFPNEDVAETVQLENVYFPGPFSFEKESAKWLTVLPKEQGLLIPNTWDVSFRQDGFRGRFGTASAYLPVFMQIKDREGYLAESLTPWNMGYDCVHEAGSNETTVQFRIEPSLQEAGYRRVMRYLFLSDCDYNTLLKCYRKIAMEEGKYKSLKEKAVQNPTVENLIGAAFVHKGIKTSVQEDSEFFDPKAPNKNNHLTTFEKRAEEMRALKREGVEKVYLHLDGWSEAGYDNQHPDVGPACSAAGGWEGLRALSRTMEELGYLFGIHDQYRDFYHKAESYDPDLSCQSPDGSIFSHARWAGGPQDYLCTTLAPFYVRRNFERMLSEKVHLDCAYLDVFTCNEGDECANPRHRMSRRESYEARNACFRYLLTKGILPSSEEVNDWAVPWLVFCHYAPYDFMLREPGSPKFGIPVPVFNLVYHDCLIIPWMMEKFPEEDYMLYALLNGGAPYLIRDPAYTGIDGAFDSGDSLSREEKRTRVKTVTDFHRKVAEAELLRHEILDEKGYRQKSTFANGYSVEVDFQEGSYRISREALS